jgi:hypothetical protein
MIKAFIWNLIIRYGEKSHEKTMNERMNFRCCSCYWGMGKTGPQVPSLPHILPRGYT